MKNKKTYLVLLLCIVIVGTYIMYNYLSYTGRKYLNYIEETWPAYIVEKDEVIATEPIEIIKEENKVTLIYQSNVCVIKYRETNAPHKCEEVDNWTIMFDEAFDAVVIEEYNDSKKMYDFFYLGVFENKPFFNHDDSNLISLAKKISTNAEHILK